jgi:hypothetical protein
MDERRKEQRKAKKWAIGAIFFCVCVGGFEWGGGGGGGKCLFVVS